MPHAEIFNSRGSVPVSPGECEAQVQRLLQSSTFRNSVTLQVLLHYLSGKTLAGETDGLKEYTIGVEALGRKPDFDPKIDPIVRVQSHRLRLKLREYYDVEGVRDAVLIQLPKGHYTTTFSMTLKDLPDPQEAISPAPETIERAIGGLEIAPLSQREENPKSTEAKTPSSQQKLTILAGLAVLAVVVAAYFLGAWNAGKKLPGYAGAGPPATNQNENDRLVEAFWTRFFGNDPSPVIAYTDAVFLLDDSNDLFRFRRGAIDSRGALVDPHLAKEFASNPEIVAQAGKLYYENGYTGTGELESIAMLANMLGRMGIKPTVKSSRDLSPDDLSNHNVILLGSPFQNAAVAQLLTAGDFSYQNPDQRREQWRAQIRDNHPRTGESLAYGTERDPTTQVLKADYSLITISPGVNPGRFIAVFGGLDTKGTEGATTFATSRVGIEHLERELKNAGQPDHGDVPPFQALIRVHLAKGYQVIGSELVSLHLLSPAKQETTDSTRAH